MRWRAHLEKVNNSTTVQARLLVDGSNDRALLALGRVQRGREVQLETLGDLVLELDLGTEQVGRGPCLGEDDAVLKVDVLALDVTGDGVRLGVTRTGNLEGRRVRSGLDLERSTVDRVVLEEQVGRRLAEVLKKTTETKGQHHINIQGR